MYYHTLAILLGVYYWPSPQRGVYLKNNIYNQLTPNFAIIAKYEVDKEVQAAIQATIGTMRKNHLYFEGFGNFVLSQCDNRNSIWKTVMEIRETTESKAFRQWSHQLDLALEQGDLPTITKNINELHEMLRAVKNSLGLLGREKKVELSLGLSPAVNIGIEEVGNQLGKLRRKPFHIVFLRNYFSRTMSNSNSWFHIKRLFPEMSSYKSFHGLPLSKWIPKDLPRGTLNQRIIEEQRFSTE